MATVSLNRFAKRSKVLVRVVFTEFLAYLTRGINFIWYWLIFIIPNICITNQGFQFTLWKVGILLLHFDKHFLPSCSWYNSFWHVKTIRNWYIFLLCQEECSNALMNLKSQPGHFQELIWFWHSLFQFCTVTMGCHCQSLPF